MFPVKIAGLGYYLPERCVDNEEIAQRLGISPDYIERAAGVRERRYATTTETTVGMAVAAARMALTTAKLDLGDLDAIVGASSAPQQAIPCTAALTQRELGAPEGRSACFDVNATCLSFAFALHAVGALVAAGAYRAALIFSSEKASCSINPNQPESYVLFGDAAAAAIVTRSGDRESSAIHHARFETHSSGADATQILGGGTLHLPDDPTTTPEMNQFSMNGRAVFRQAGQLITPFLDRFFEETGWTRESVRMVIPHQASGHAVNLLTSRLGFTDEQVFLNLRDRGNCVAASIPLALAEAIQAGRIERGDRVLLAGTGAGLTLGALAMTY
jgi:3-oxoacyl-[acyl-carrier-protein] synthase III